MFERIQDEIILLFDQLCGGAPGHRSKMGTIIGATSSFNVKIDLVRQAAISFIDKEDSKKAVLNWIRLCKKAAEIRNKIAHGQPTSLHFVWDGEPRYGVFWAPSTYDTRKANFPQQLAHDWEYCWNENQIKEYSRNFFALRTMLMTVREELAGVGEESMPQVLDPSLMVKTPSR